MRKQTTAAQPELVEGQSPATAIHSAVAAIAAVSPRRMRGPSEIARACGKQNVHHLEPEDLVALTVESAAMARVPLAGTSWIPGLNVR